MSVMRKAPGESQLAWGLRIINMTVRAFRGSQSTCAFTVTDAVELSLATVQTVANASCHCNLFYSCSNPVVYCAHNRSGPLFTGQSWVPRCVADLQTGFTTSHSDCS